MTGEWEFQLDKRDERIKERAAQLAKDAIKNANGVKIDLKH